jgi:hypothetical protein
MKYLFIFILSLNFMDAQSLKNLDLVVNASLPSLSYMTLNTSTLSSNKYNQNFVKLKVNKHYRDIKRGFFVLSKEAFINYDQFDYDVFKYTPEDALRKITPNYDLHSAPLPSPTYYPID